MSQPQEQPKESTTYQRIGSRVREARLKSQHSSQEALALASGFSVDTISRVENGHGSHITTLQTLADALGVTMASLFE